MEISKEKVVRPEIDILSIAEFARKMGDGITPQAVAYAINNDKLDYVWIGSERFIVINDKSRSYVPNSHPRRTTMET